MIKKIISAGETGVDRGALDFAIKSGVAHGGFCPKGRRSESGRISDKYDLIETGSHSFGSAMIKNVHHSDGTLIITRGSPTGGTGKTEDIAISGDKPKYVIRLERKLDPAEFVQWVLANKIETVFIAGPRESKQPGIQKATVRILTNLFQHLRAA